MPLSGGPTRQLLVEGRPESGGATGADRHAGRDRTALLRDARRAAHSRAGVRRRRRDVRPRRGHRQSAIRDDALRRRRSDRAAHQADGRRRRRCPAAGAGMGRRSSASRRPSASGSHTEAEAGSGRVPAASRAAAGVYASLIDSRAAGRRQPDDRCSAKRSAPSTPDLPLFDILTMDEQLAQQRWAFRIFGTMFAIFAVHRAGAVGGGPVRGHRLFGVAADAGDRRADGARRAGSAGAVADSAALDRAAGDWPGDRHRPARFGVGRLLAACWSRRARAIRSR